MEYVTNGNTAAKELVSRKVYFFECEGCRKKRRQTFRKSKAEVGLCRSCRQDALEVHKSQLNLFEVEQAVEPTNEAKALLSMDSVPDGYVVGVDYGKDVFLAGA
jgi:hypothetical protein